MTVCAKENPCRILLNFMRSSAAMRSFAHKMSTPDAAANADEYARMMRDYKELTP